MQGFVGGKGAASCLWQFILFITTFCLALLPNTVCFNVIFSLESDHDSGTESDLEFHTFDDSLPASDSGEDDEAQIVWAKAGRGIWGLGHVFEASSTSQKILLMTVLTSE